MPTNHLWGGSLIDSWPFKTLTHFGGGPQLFRPAIPCRIAPCRRGSARASPAESALPPAGMAL